jgi:hypothetical protein
LYGGASNLWVLTIGIKPFEVEVGSLTSGEGGGTTAAFGGSGALEFMTSLNAQSMQDLEGPEAVVGGSVKAVGDLGLDIGLARSDDPNNPNRKNSLIDTETVSVGIGAVATPYELPVEFHGGGGYSASSYTTNVTSQVTSMASAAASGIQSAYQSAVSLIQQEINVIQQEISQISSGNSNSSKSTNSK